MYAPHALLSFSTLNIKLYFMRWNSHSIMSNITRTQRCAIAHQIRSDIIAFNIRTYGNGLEFRISKTKLIHIRVMKNCAECGKHERWLLWINNAENKRPCFIFLAPIRLMPLPSQAFMHAELYQYLLSCSGNIRIFHGVPRTMTINGLCVERKRWEEEGKWMK